MSVIKAEKEFVSHFYLIKCLQKANKKCITG